MRNMFVLILIVFAVIFAAVVFTTDAKPVSQESLLERKIYAYRDWQSVGLRVHPDEIVHIRASGTWLYTPGEYHGPDGHPRFPAPAYYPLARAPGGVLLARVGEHGKPIHIGKRSNIRPNSFGLLYFRINDDILGDNDGYVVVEIEVEGSDE